MSLKVTVEEEFDGEVKKLEIEYPFTGRVDEIADVFRTIMYFLTFVEGTVNDLITSNEDLEDIRDARIADLEANRDLGEDDDYGFSSLSTGECNCDDCNACK